MAPDDNNSYDPRTFWNVKAKAYSKDPNKAVCYSDPVKNDCVDKVQRALVGRALRALSRHLPIPGRKILDYGCGVGRWAEYFQKAGLLYSGVDIAEEMIGIAQNLFPKVDFRTLDGGKIPYPASSFDIACSISAIHHNAYPEQERILEEILRILRPGGYLLLFESIAKWETDISYMFARTRAEWITFLENFNLKCQWSRGGRYFVITELSKKLAQLTRLKKSSHSFQIPGRLAKMDSVLSPFLGSLLPEKYQSRAVMLFKSGLH